MTKYIVENPFLSLVGAIAIIALVWWLIKNNTTSTTVSTNGTTPNVGTRVSFNGNGNGNLNGNGSY